MGRLISESWSSPRRAVGGWDQIGTVLDIIRRWKAGAHSSHIVWKPLLTGIRPVVGELCRYIIAGFVPRGRKPSQATLGALRIIDDLGTAGSRSSPIGQFQVVAFVILEEAGPPS